MLSDPNPEFLRPVQSDEFLPPISLWTTLGGLFLVSTVGAAITLAAVIKYNVTVKAPATVRPLGELRIVQAATEETVTSFKVKENQVVNTGRSDRYHRQLPTPDQKESTLCIWPCLVLKAFNNAG